MLGKTFYETLQQSQGMNTAKQHKDFKNGVYDVTKYVVNKDSLPALASDTIRWQNLVIDNNGSGSAATRDTIFRNRYGRGYFNFTVDTLQPVINFKKYQQDSLYTLSLTYAKPDSNTIQLWGKHHNDSLFIELKKSNRHFQLAERQFHWLSEGNR